ncbi:hypothetical protein P7K49_013185 [Saguinus oedipus]|uniref:Uncharacterized protein n=1 Tax=Saguinus oedipus TaxID=9490 RepID=A0ABQ9VF59_SAGOE|nr:hypothetical protein P7K49_013185 [Saguinus oedipus]
MWGGQMPLAVELGRSSLRPEASASRPRRTESTTGVPGAQDLPGGSGGHRARRPLLSLLREEEEARAAAAPRPLQAQRGPKQGQEAAEGGHLQGRGCFLRGAVLWWAGHGACRGPRPRPPSARAAGTSSGTSARSGGPCGEAETPTQASNSGHGPALRLGTFFFTKQAVTVAH